jgi:hypothetical protein
MSLLAITGNRLLYVYGQATWRVPTKQSTERSVLVQRQISMVAVCKVILSIEIAHPWQPSIMIWCVCLCVCVCVCVWIYKHIYIHIYIYIHTYIPTYIYMYVCVHVCMYVHIYVCICICTYAYTYICIYTKIMVHKWQHGSSTFSCRLAQSSFMVWGLGFEVWGLGCRV